MATSESPDLPGVRPLACLWWALVGATAGFGLLALLSVGPLLLAVAVAMALAGVRSPALRGRSAATVLAGVAAAPLFLAWVRRDGPGLVCRVEADVTSCSETGSPWPSLAVAVLLVGAGSALALRVRR